MSDDLLRRALQRGGCRLCMAPDTECVPIFATAAADKEPLSSKILACVNIKVHQGDRLSARVCHACISYLNSWQSFKNRCNAAQKKQRSLLEMVMAKEKQKGLVAPMRPQLKPLDYHQREAQSPQQKLLKQALSQPTSSSPLNPNSVANNESGSIDVSFIKEEPEDMSQFMDDDEEVDPTQFLARDNDDETDLDGTAGQTFAEEGPPILTSLGLTHINHVNPYSFLSTELTDSMAPQADDADDMMYVPGGGNQQVPQPSCTICNMKFSNRANARRHERNIHGIKQQDSILSSSSLSLMTSGNSLTLKPMQRRKSAVPRHIPSGSVVYDYSKPEMYRELLTDSKLYFIKRHIEFLEQYQNMRCKCCDRDFPTYKFFMAHMRKKYDTLSRNLCFKCLKQFETKSQFIAHLKKKNCINLYKLYLADDTFSKEPLPSTAAGSARTGTKEIIANKVYGCKLCSKTFRLKMDFRGHVYEAHGEEQKKETMGPACGFCKQEFEDPAIRRRHYNNMECIVFLICGTCEEKFDTLAQYIEHVYARHLQPIKSEYSTAASAVTSLWNDDMQTNVSGGEYDPVFTKYPQNCKVCGKQYNNYYNVLRHMESKHPDQMPATYRCEECDVGYPRQSELRDHMYKKHGITVPKIKREIYNCRMCGAMFDHKELWIDHQATTHSKFFCHMCDVDFDDREELEKHLTEHGRQKSHTCTLCQHSFNSERGLETHLAVMHLLKRDQMPPSTKNNTSDGDDKETSLQLPDVHINGDTPDISHTAADDDEDIDESMQQAMKKIKMELPIDGSISVVPAGNLMPKKPSIMANSNIKTCTMCQETFCGTIALSNHMRSHARNPNRPISSFKRTGATGEPHVNSRMRCRLCQKRIHTKQSYKRHMLHVHQVRDCVFITCKLCPAEFSNDKGLKVHMFRTHNITVQQMQQDERLRPTPKQESTSSGPNGVPLSGGEGGPSTTQYAKILPKPEPKVFECDICHTVYRNKDQLKAHRSVVHGVANADNGENDGGDNDSEFDNGNAELDEMVDPALAVPEAWWQCRYCDENFNASKKLTIHMNSHEEHDTTDNTCTDCGNVYRTRKSLWVHRHKKHPRIPNPSTCELCQKVFFDKTELFHHLKTHSNSDVFSHLTEMQSQLSQEQGAAMRQTAAEELSCHLCGQKFHDKRVLSKHLRLHETSQIQAAASVASTFDNPLMSMLADQSLPAEENGSDFIYPMYQGQMVDGEYACDMCPKRFPLMNALKVHRGWHFRSPDGRQVTDPSNMWQPDSVPQSKGRRSRLANPPICPYCNSTFASGNNLRRHIVEVHKRNEAKMMRENGTVSESVYVEKELECHNCDITFSNRAEWVDHKISHARTMKPSTTFEWGCEICGKVFTRKERLLAHMIVHLSGKEELNNSHTTGDQNSEMGAESNSRSSISSQSQSQQSQESSRNRLIQNKTVQEQKSCQLAAESAGNKSAAAGAGLHEIPSGSKREDMEVDEDEEDLPQDDEEELEDEEHQQDEDEEPAYSCDLCQVFFRTAKELRRHVTSHIINGPEVSQPETTKVSGEQRSPVDDDDDDDDVDDEDEDGDDEEEEINDADDDDGEINDDDDEDEEEDEINPPNKTSPKSSGSYHLDGFRCRLCGSSSESHIGMIQCMESHKSVSATQCDECKLYFKDSIQMENHEKLCHPSSSDS